MHPESSSRTCGIYPRAAVIERHVHSGVVGLISTLDRSHQLGPVLVRLENSEATAGQFLAEVAACLMLDRRAALAMQDAGTFARAIQDQPDGLTDGHLLVDSLGAGQEVPV